MKHKHVMHCLLLFLLTALCFGCAKPAPAAPAGPVFPEGEIIAVRFHGLRNSSVDVPEEHLAEITAWLHGFKVGKPLGKGPEEPGLNSYFVTITYADGAELYYHSIDLVEQDGTIFYINRPDLPDCWYSIWENSNTGENDPPEPGNTWTVTDGITLRLMNSEFPEGVERMTLIMENRTDQVMLYGNGWSFERYEEGEWVPLPNREDAAWTMEGYTLYEHKRDVFHVPTSAIQETLTEGFYRVTGCTLRVAADDDNLNYGGDYTDYPAYQLEFAVTKDALPDRGWPETSPAPGTLREKEDWEWYTPWDGLRLMENRGQTVWQFTQSDGEDGLVALLCRPNAPEYEYLNEGDLLSLYLFDRKTGELYAAVEELAVEQDSVLPGEQGGFFVEIEGETRFFD